MRCVRITVDVLILGVSAKFLLYSLGSICYKLADTLLCAELAAEMIKLSTLVEKTRTVFKQSQAIVVSTITASQALGGS